jgi:peptidase MA superfamily protein
VTRSRPAAVARTLAILALALIAAGLGPTSAFAAEAPTFGDPVVKSVFLSGITITEPVALPAGVSRVEALVQIEGSERTFTTPIDLPPAGSTTLRFRFDTPGGSIMPNTLVEMGFRVTLSDGTAVRGPTARVRYDDTRFAWQTRTGSLVRVHWTDGGDAFGKRALSIAEGAIAKASNLLGVTETKPIDFFVYADRTAFYDVLGPAAHENIGGVAFPDIRTLFANISSTTVDDPWVSIVIPHELTHIVFGTATENRYHSPTHWLNEGLAVYLSEGFTSGSRSSVQNAVGDGTLMPLTALDGEFPSSGERFALAYDEAVSAVDFMVRTYGRDGLVALIRSYADGLTDDEAFRTGIGLDVAGFEAAWLADLGASAPSPYGPQPAPAGPLPSGWLGAAATAGAASASGVPAAPSVDGRGTPAGMLAGLVVLALFIGALVAAAAIMKRRRRLPPPGGGWA